MPREGHAAAAWRDSSLIMFGGWGSGIRSDLYVLKPTARVRAVQLYSSSVVWQYSSSSCLLTLEQYRLC